MFRKNIDFSCGVSLDPILVVARKNLTLGIQGLIEYPIKYKYKACLKHQYKFDYLLHNFKTSFMLSFFMYEVKFIFALNLS